MRCEDDFRGQGLSGQESGGTIQLERHRRHANHVRHVTDVSQYLGEVFAIPDQQQPLLLLIPKGEGEHTIELLPAFFVPMPIDM